MFWFQYFPADVHRDSVVPQHSISNSVIGKQALKRRGKFARDVRRVFVRIQECYTAGVNCDAETGSVDRTCNFANMEFIVIRML